MLEVLALRALLVALPFAVWFLWREIARRNGAPMGSTPWPWLFAAGGFLAGLSLMASAVLQGDNRGQAYVPAEVSESGQVSPGYFERRP